MLRETVSAMQKRLVDAGDVGRRQRRLLRARRRAAERDLPARRRARNAAEPRSLERGDHARRPARRSAGELPRHLARHRPAPRARTSSTRRRGRTASRSSRRTGAVDAAYRRRVRRRARLVPAGDPEHRPRRPRRRRRPAARRFGSQPGTAVLVARGNAAAKLQAEAQPGTVVTLRLILQPDWSVVSDAIGGGPVLVRDGAPVYRVERGVHDVAARAARPAHGGRPARRRRDRPRDDRRTPARLLGRDDELRARADARALRRGARAWRSTAAARRRWRSRERC